MAHTTTMRDTTQVELWHAVDSLRQFDVDKDLYFFVNGKNMASEASFFAWLMGNTPVQKMKTISPEFNHIEYRESWLTPSSGTFASGTLSTSTAVGGTVTNLVLGTLVPGNNGVIAIFDADDLSKFMLLHVYTSAAAGSSNSATLLTTASFTPASGDPVYLTSLAYAEGSDMATSNHVTPIKKWGCTQIFKGSVTLSRTVLKDKSIAYGQELPFQLGQKKLEILKKADNALLFSSGRVGATVTNPWSAPPTTYPVDTSGDPVRTTMSLEQALQRAFAVNAVGESRVIDITKSSATYIDDIVTNFETVFHYGNYNKTAMCGTKFMTFVQQLALASPTNFQVMNGAEKYGLKVKVLQTPHGDLELIHNRGMAQIATLSNTCYVIDPDSVFIREFDPMQVFQSQTTLDAEIWQVLIDTGLQVINPEYCSILRAS